MARHEINSATYTINHESNELTINRPEPDINFNLRDINAVFFGNSKVTVSKAEVVYGKIYRFTFDFNGSQFNDMTDVQNYLGVIEEYGFYTGESTNPITVIHGAELPENATYLIPRIVTNGKHAIKVVHNNIVLRTAEPKEETTVQVTIRYNSVKIVGHQDRIKKSRRIVVGGIAVQVFSLLFSGSDTSEISQRNIIDAFIRKFHSGEKTLSIEFE